MRSTLRSERQRLQTSTAKPVPRARLNRYLPVHCVDRWGKPPCSGKRNNAVFTHKNLLNCSGICSTSCSSPAARPTASALFARRLGTDFKEFAKSSNDLYGLLVSTRLNFFDHGFDVINLSFEILILDFFNIHLYYF